MCDDMCDVLYDVMLYCNVVQSFVVERHTPKSVWRAVTVGASNTISSA